MFQVVFCLIFILDVPGYNEEIFSLPLDMNGIFVMSISDGLITVTMTTGGPERSGGCGWLEKKPFGDLSEAKAVIEDDDEDVGEVV